MFINGGRNRSFVKKIISLAVVRKGRRRFRFIGLDRRGVRCRGDAREDRRQRRPERAVPRRHLAALDMRAQSTIVAFKRGLTPKSLRTDIALGAAAAAGEQAAHEEKVERAPPAATAWGRRRRQVLLRVCA